MLNNMRLTKCSSHPQLPLDVPRHSRLPLRQDPRALRHRALRTAMLCDFHIQRRRLALPELSEFVLFAFEVDVLDRRVARSS